MKGKLRPGDLFIQSDFDGTITMKDVMVDLNENFSEESWRSVIDRWDRKEITTREALLEMYSMIRATPQQIKDFIERVVVIRDGFQEFVQWCDETGLELVIVSEGLDLVVEETLRKAKVSVRVITNHAEFVEPYITVTFPETPPICDHQDGDICGTCKLAHLGRAKALGRTSVYIGDGTTDARPARHADIVFARRALARIFTDEGREFIPFEDFYVVRDHLEDLLS